MKIFKRGSTYHYDFILDGRRYQGSTKLKNKRQAEDLVANIRAREVNENRGFKFSPEAQQEIPIPRFREQAEAWLTHLRNRKRKPIVDSSVPSIRGALNKWLLPAMGALRLSEVNHVALRGLVEKMAAAGLAAKTIGTYTVMAKQIVASLTDDDGQPVVSRKWDNDRIDLPIVHKREQRRATLTATQIEALIAICEEDWERVLYTLCCASGLRISEALALDREHLSDDCSVIYVRQQVKANKIAACLKTDAAWRDVDLDPAIAGILREYTTHHVGLLFPSQAGKPRSYSNLYNRGLRPKLEKLGFYIEGAGAHCFRRFRAAHLKRMACPDDLRKFWLGHASEDISDHYALQLLDDMERRKAVVASVGTGLEVGKSPYNFHYSGLPEGTEPALTQ